MDSHFQIYFARPAAKTFESLPRRDKDRIVNALNLLAENPYFGANIRKLKGKLDGSYRLRIGDYRIVYRIKDNEKELEVILVIQRSKGY